MKEMLLAVGLLSLAGCSSQSQVVGSGTAKTQSQTPAASPGASDNQAPPKEAKRNQPLLITPSVGVGPIKFGMSANEVEAVLGKPYRVTGKAHEYQHLGLAVVFDRQDQVGAILGGAWCEISDILLDVFKGATAKGIKLKSSKQAITSAYGPPSTVATLGVKDREFEVLRYDSLRMDFALRQGKLVHITLKRPRGPSQPKRSL